jgi:hypothetical protein
MPLKALFGQLCPSSTTHTTARTIYEVFKVWFWDPREGLFQEVHNMKSILIVRNNMKNLLAFCMCNCKYSGVFQRLYDTTTNIEAAMRI